MLSDTVDCALLSDTGMYYAVWHCGLYSADTVGCTLLSDTGMYYAV